MPLVRSVLILALALAPAAALAQTVIVEPPLPAEEAIIAPALPMAEAPLGGPLSVDDAVAIAMMYGIVHVEDVDHRIWDGNFEVEGTDAAGEDLEILVDGNSGAVLDIDD